MNKGWSKQQIANYYENFIIEQEKLIGHYNRKLQYLKDLEAYCDRLEEENAELKKILEKN